MQILLLAPYFGGSHRVWAQGYAHHSRHQVSLVTLPARFWKWRMQGGAVTLAKRARALGVQPDLLLVTDMVNVPAFLGLTRPRFATVPVALYCHETQLTYPSPPGETPDLTYPMLNWLSMLAADRVFFNSTFHLEAWFEALPNLLKHFPDFTHLHLIPSVQEKSAVLPVGCDLHRLDAGERAPSPEAPPLILWNHRWEYDKHPQAFFRALDALTAEGRPFRVALAGANARRAPEEFVAARRRLGERVVHYGWADAATYARLLQEADVVVSTALHEFFGISMVEALYCRCFPVLPARLVYPELLPEAYHERCLYATEEGLLRRLRWALDHREAARRLGAELRAVVARFDWRVQAPRYDQTLVELTGEVVNK